MDGGALSRRAVAREEHVFGIVELDALEPLRDRVDGGALVDRSRVAALVDEVGFLEDLAPEEGPLRDGKVLEVPEGL